jgi:lipopolysaccharide export system permease protein
MLFHSSIRQELARSFVATLVVLITVVMSMMLIRTLGLAARGTVNPRDVIMLMGYAVLGNLATIMTLSLFIAVTNTLSRMYRESEMAVWFASGKGLVGFVSPVFRFAWPILLAIALLALVVWPWASQQTATLRAQYAQRGDLDRVAVGQFQESANGSRVVFVESVDSKLAKLEDANADSSSGAGNATKSTPAASTASNTALSSKQTRNVFVSEIVGDKQVITSARSGKLDTINDDPFIVLQNGQRIEQNSTKQQITVVDFEQYAVVANPSRLASASTPPVKSLPTLQLLDAPTPPKLAELSWRLGLALTAVNLLLLAMLVSAVNPRAGRGFGIVFALLAFAVYYNLLNVGFSRIATGRSGFVSWMLLLHGGILALTLLWIAARHHQWSWRQLLPRQRALAPQPS